MSQLPIGIALVRRRQPYERRLNCFVVFGEMMIRIFVVRTTRQLRLHAVLVAFIFFSIHPSAQSMYIKYNSFGYGTTKQKNNFFFFDFWLDAYNYT